MTFVCYAWNMYSVHTPDFCTLYISYFWPLPYANYRHLTPALYMLHTPDPCRMHIKNTCLLYSVCCINKMPALCTIHIPDPLHSTPKASVTVGEVAYLMITTSCCHKKLSTASKSVCYTHTPSLFHGWVSAQQSIQQNKQDNVTFSLLAMCLSLLNVKDWPAHPQY